MPDSNDDILRLESLRVGFHTHAGPIDAVRGISFSVPRGATVALVGESGSGKSVTSYAILRLLQKPGRILDGKILFRPRDQNEIDVAALRESDQRLYTLRGGQIGMIFQEPMTALSPVHTIGDQIAEAVRLHRNVTKRQAWTTATEMLAHVGVTDTVRRMNQYPFEFSGGMRQRVVIAMALVSRPQLLIADEPTTALDVTVQAQVLKLIAQLKQELNTSVIFITHDLAVVAQIADQVVVMKSGQIVEQGPTRQILQSPQHPYTQNLLNAVPQFEPAGRT